MILSTRYRNVTLFKNKVRYIFGIDIIDFMFLLYPKNFLLLGQFGSKVGGLRFVASIQISRAAARSPKLSHGYKKQISCSIVRHLKLISY